jgi:hypothetical protein
VPLRAVVASLLIDWAVTSDDSDESDDFCGWHVGSRVRGGEGPCRATAPSTALVSGRPPGPSALAGQRNCVVM